jgi:1,2-diacylglycerol 3-beta-galactosyltransferase
METKKKILILTADAGFGHRSAAIAIKNAIEEKQKDEFDVLIVNPLDNDKAPLFLRESQSEYDKWVRNVPELYKFGYEISDAAIPVSILETILTVTLFEVIRETLEAYQPDIVVNTYPLYQAPFIAVRSLLKLDIPIATIVTDLATVHNIWFHEDVDLLIVPTSKVKGDAIKAGFSSDRIAEIGIPVNPKIFLLKEDKQKLRKDLGWNEEKTTVLAVGSKRVEHFKEYLHVLNHTGFNFQLVVVTGKDKKLFEELEKIEWHLPVFLYEFVENMPEFMKASDLLLSKAGGLIVTEALASGLPIIIVDAIPGQETGNAKFVEEAKAGYWVKSNIEFLETISHLFINSFEQLQIIQRNAENKGKPSAAMQIIDLIIQQLSEKKNQTKPKIDLIKKLEELLLANHIHWK